ncbi:hypothetical protein Gbem_4099 [Citrifermentans bemidjiense Bem]|uniref:Uncharacterized protein n=1 Tax=Citrifermentans bemidjiense (strain ATCC BAA-1014 / DSM 16622 / JCM 12645 / Bem) TaxID=404380 RepID=E1P6A5_CITBB|nr:hypothetical protein Gbem_4099 [Citrifermentans bemidjiense Bem]
MAAAKTAAITFVRIPFLAAYNLGKTPSGGDYSEIFFPRCGFSHRVIHSFCGRLPQSNPH